MTTLLVFFGVSFGLSLLLTPLARNVASRCGLTDKPDQRRKLHGQSIPVAGGIAVLLASLSTVPLLLLADACPFQEDFSEQALHWLGLASASIFICVVGVLDDLGLLRGRHKLLGQLFAIGILIATGLVVRNIRIGELDIDLGLLAVPFTAFFLLGAINSLNLLDGMDGLLGTVALIVTLAFAGMAAMSGKWATACVSVTISGALLGFLRYNLPPASVYLGDAGSMLIGLVVGSLAIKGSLKGPATFALAAPVAILAIPILDTMAAIFRRKLTGRSIFTTDRGHIHHCLLRHGFSKVKVLLLVSLFCLLSVSGAYLGITLNNEWMALLAAVTVVFILIGMRWFGHGETLLVADRLKNLARAVLKFPGSGSHDSAILLQGKGAWTDPWAKMIQSAEEMSLKMMRLDVNAPALHESYNARWVNPEDEDLEVGETSWNAAIPLVWQDQTVGRLEVSGNRDGEPIWKKVAELTKLVDELEFILFKIADDAGLNAQCEVETVSRSAVPSFNVPLTK